MSTIAKGVTACRASPYGTSRAPRRFEQECDKERGMGKGILMWLIGIPIPIIILILIFWH